MSAKMVDLAAIQKRWSAASPGQWELDRDPSNGSAFRFRVEVSEGSGRRMLAFLPVGDAAFIAGAHQDVPALLELVEAQAAALREIVASMAEYGPRAQTRACKIAEGVRPRIQIPPEETKQDSPPLAADPAPTVRAPEPLIEGRLTETVDGVRVIIG